jgi:hypothetical protein
MRPAGLPARSCAKRLELSSDVYTCSPLRSLAPSKAQLRRGTNDPLVRRSNPRWARDNELGASGWEAAATALAGLPRLTSVDGIRLCEARLDLSRKEDGMALAIATHLLSRNTSTLASLDLRFGGEGLRPRCRFLFPASNELFFSRLPFHRSLFPSYTIKRYIDCTPFLWFSSLLS